MMWHKNCELMVLWVRAKSGGREKAMEYNSRVAVERFICTASTGEARHGGVKSGVWGTKFGADSADG